MKNKLLGLAAIALCLIIAIFFYQKTIEPALQKSKAGQEKQPPQKEQQQVQPLYAEKTVDYSLKNDELNITFDKGKSWKTVLIDKDKLFAGEYSGDKQELIENSYVLTSSRVAFLYADYSNIVLTYSLDQGKHWQNSTVKAPYPALRFRKVYFLNENFGYILLTGDRTMSQEMSNVYLTHDGGQTWAETNSSNVTRLLYDGGFVDEQTGFLSYGILNPTEPDLYVTEDGGQSWTKATISIPESYQKIFVCAETPFKEADHLAVFINQGSSGDYKGGKVKGKFLSSDNGKTWVFFEEVLPNESVQ